ncbi:unnamed protein product [Cylindrotheca closterium]|uniref:Uncharacterized protein n=1 Tax=Cylindrotheca closterium TaxID=2856 RepID=A0AAD2FWS2_9STRA|nr:unnamed protein product [Cylindrotheca closterium]
MIQSSSTTAPTSHLYRLRKTLIPLICFLLIGFIINFGGIYHDISDGYFGNPIHDATNKEWKSLVAKERDTRSLIVDEGEKGKYNIAPNNFKDWKMTTDANNCGDRGPNFTASDRAECGPLRSMTNSIHGRMKHTTTTMKTKITGAGMTGDKLPLPTIIDHQTLQPIPRRLIFTHHTHLIDRRFPRHLYKNVQNTIQTYADLWGVENKSNVEVMFFDDQDCARVIEASEPKLVPIFWAEKTGAYRADICRIAALYTYGGYYLDVDIEPIQALDPPPQVDFITAQAGNRAFFQAVMASTLRHPLMKHTMETMLVDWYMIPTIMKDHGKTEFEPQWFRSQTYTDLRLEHVAQYGFDLNHTIGILMGPVTLRIAYDRNVNLTTPWLLQEFENKDEKLYPALIRETSYWGCNFMVHDNATKTPYFYSRCKGTPMCVFYKEKKTGT